MSGRQKICFVMLLCLLVSAGSGCALLQAPFSIAKSAFDLLGKVFSVVDKLPKPPPGVF